MAASLHRLVTHPALALGATVFAGLLECWALLRARRRLR